MFWNVHLLVTEFDCSEVNLCGWEDVKIQLLTNFNFISSAILHMASSNSIYNTVVVITTLCMSTDSNN